MKERRSRASKVHFQHNGNHRTLCGLDGRTTYMVNSMTCRVCMFHYLAESASWARRFLDDLRGKPAVRPRGRDQTPPESQRDKDLRERGYHVSVGSAEYGDRNARRSPPMVLEYLGSPSSAGELSELLLGKLAGTGQGHAVAVPAGATTPVNGQEKGLGNGFARAFGHKGDPQKAIRELLSVIPTRRAAVQEVMDYCRASADTVGVQPGEVTEQAGDAGKVGDEAGGNFKAPE